MAGPIALLVSSLFNRPQGKKYSLQPRGVVSGSGAVGLANISKPTGRLTPFLPCSVGRFAFAGDPIEQILRFQYVWDRRLSNKWVNFHLRCVKFLPLILSPRGWWIDSDLTQGQQPQGDPGKALMQAANRGAKGASSGSERSPLGQPVA